MQMIPEADYDSPWKEALERYLPQCLALFLPHVHADVDWSQSFSFLETELQQITPAAAVGRRVVDKLVRVRRRDGEDAWVLIHLEVQNQEERDFARRMYGYHARLLDRFDQPVASIAILGDERLAWRPSVFQQGLWGCTITFEFPIVKLTDFRQRWDELEASTNPFAGVVMAHLRALDTRQDASERRGAKFGLVRWLLTRGYSREEVLELFRVIDWFLRLPEELERAFLRDVQAYEEAEQVAYISSAERIGREMGLQEGRQEGLELGRQEGLQQGLQQGRRDGLLAGLEQLLTLRFGDAGRAAFDEVRGIEDVAVLEALVRRIGEASLEELRAIYRTSGR